MKKVHTNHSYSMSGKIVHNFEGDFSSAVLQIKYPVKAALQNKFDFLTYSGKVNLLFGSVSSDPASLVPFSLYYKRWLRGASLDSSMGKGKGNIVAKVFRSATYSEGCKVAYTHSGTDQLWNPFACKRRLQRALHPDGYGIPCSSRKFLCL